MKYTGFYNPYHLQLVNPVSRKKINGIPSPRHSCTIDDYISDIVEKGRKSNQRIYADYINTTGNGSRQKFYRLSGNVSQAIRGQQCQYASVTTSVLRTAAMCYLKDNFPRKQLERFVSRAYTDSDGSLVEYVCRLLGKEPFFDESLYPDRSPKERKLRHTYFNRNHFDTRSGYKYEWLYLSTTPAEKAFLMGVNDMSTQRLFFEVDITRHAANADNSQHYKTDQIRLSDYEFQSEDVLDTVGNAYTLLAMLQHSLLKKLIDTAPVCSKTLYFEYMPWFMRVPWHIGREFVTGVDEHYQLKRGPSKEIYEYWKQHRATECFDSLMDQWQQYASQTQITIPLKDMIIQDMGDFEKLAEQTGLFKDEKK